MKNLIWVRQVSTNVPHVVRLNGPFSSYKKAEKFLLRVGDGTIVTESLKDAKVRVVQQASDEYDHSNTGKLLVNTLDAMAIEPKKKKTEVIQSVPKRQVAKRTSTRKAHEKKVPSPLPVE